MRLPRTRTPYIVLALAALAVVLLANAHMLYVAAKSQPDCVAHLKADAGTPEQTGHVAAKSAC